MFYEDGILSAEVVAEVSAQNRVFKPDFRCHVTSMARRAQFSLQKRVFRLNLILFVCYCEQNKQNDHFPSVLLFRNTPVAPKVCAQK